MRTNIYLDEKNINNITSNEYRLSSQDYMWKTEYEISPTTFISFSPFFWPVSSLYSTSSYNYNFLTEYKHSYNDENSLKSLKYSSVLTKLLQNYHGTNPTSYQSKSPYFRQTSPL